MIANWKDLTHDERVTVCRQMDSKFTKRRAEWQKTHKASYEFAILHNIVERKKAPNGTHERCVKAATRLGQIAAYRDDLHHRLKHNPALERMAGDELAKTVDMGWPAERCVAHVERMLWVYA